MLAQELVDRMKKAMKHRVPAETVDRSAELIPGMKYRNERGRMVTVMRVSHLRVMYRYEGYPCHIADLKSLTRKQVLTILFRF